MKTKQYPGNDYNLLLAYTSIIILKKLAVIQAVARLIVSAALTPPQHCCAGSQAHYTSSYTLINIRIR